MIHLPSSLLTLAQNTVDGSVAVGVGGLLVLVFLLGSALLGIALLAFWIWMLVDCARREFPGDNDKLIWILIIVLTSWIGALIYFFVGRPKGTIA